MTTKYKQCKLVKGSFTRVAWIPEKFAQVNMILEIKDEGDTWDNGWVVEEVYSTIIRETTDINQDKALHNKYRHLTGK